jgi:hypothetical protein
MNWDVPGPGSYDRGSDLNRSGPAFTMPGKLRGSGGADIPGPGNYDAANLVEGSPAYTMGRRYKSGINALDVGPASYDPAR